MTQEVVVGALVRDGQVLLGHRRADRDAYPDAWDLPGGHVEPGEAELDALTRELEEELGVRVDPSAAMPLVRWTARGGPEPVVLSAWLVERWDGTPVNRAPHEHDEVRWFPAGELPPLAHRVVEAALREALGVPEPLPLSEHDPAPRAFLEPTATVQPLDVPAACVVTFFGDVVDRLVSERGARVLHEQRWEDGPHPLLELEHDGQRLAVLRCGVGAPLAGGLLEEVIARGSQAFVVCGGAGTLAGELTLGHAVVVADAIRDEGTSYHYLPPARSIRLDEDARRVLEQVLVARGTPYVVGRTWTTDAPYRETAGKIARRRAEGCLTVEMEAAALAAVAAFRGVPLAQLVYCGDDLTGETWDGRSWQGLAQVREELFDLAASAAVALARS